MNRLERFQMATNVRFQFSAYLSILPDEHRGGFIQNLMDAEIRFIGGAIGRDEFSGIVGELQRDVKGIAAGVMRVQAQRSANRARGVITLEVVR